MKTFKGNTRDLGEIENPRDIYCFRDGSKIQFNKGQKDDYRVTYFPNGDENDGYSPMDYDYFEDLLDLKNKDEQCNSNRVWEELLQVSNLVQQNGIENNGNPVVDDEKIQEARAEIGNIAIAYPEDLQQDVFKLFMTLWALFISEWYYVMLDGSPSKLKHTPKLIGSYQALNGIYIPKKSAEFSKNDSMINSELEQLGVDFEPGQRRFERLQKIMDVYEIDYSWLP